MIAVSPLSLIHEQTRGRPAGYRWGDDRQNADAVRAAFDVDVEDRFGQPARLKRADAPYA